MTEPESTSAAGRTHAVWPRILVKLLAIVTLILLANIFVSWLIDRVEIQVWPSHMESVDRAVLVGVILYIVLMALPFMPGIEMGLAMMIMLGPRGIVVAYVCTVIALTISFGLGRLFPTHLLIALLRWLHLTRAAASLQEFDATPPGRRLEYLAGDASKRILPALFRHRYLLLALLFNMPGNAVIGGGGGIAMLSGMSRLFSFPLYLLLISVAILPGPILIMLTKPA